jgi:hypothetical protein
MESSVADTLGTTAMEEQRLISTIVESNVRSAELECDHFYIIIAFILLIVACIYSSIALLFEHTQHASIICAS